MPIQPNPALHWLQAGEAFPPVDTAWGIDSPASGLLAAGGALDVSTLRKAYAQGIFPWYSAGQPTLWWSPDPRMVLHLAEFILHRSLRKTLQKFKNDPRCEIRIDYGFEAVVRACAQSPRKTRHTDVETKEDDDKAMPHTWIQPEMVAAYTALHQAGWAHSVETWVGGQLVGGLYCTALGAAVFGESMFSHASDASKIALCALVALCRAQGVARIDCQQNTAHLASLGAREMPRSQFCQRTALDAQKPALNWQFEPIYWNTVLPPKSDY